MQLIQGDSLDVLKTLETDSIDSIVTDPPYGLKFMGAKWDYDVPSVDVWRECLRVLKPGGHLLSFSSARTYHRMVVNIEDSGFEIRDQIMWIYGSGFPKGQDVSKAIDKRLKAERKVIGHDQNRGKTKLGDGKHALGDYQGHWNITEPATPEAKQWNGWNTSLKGAHEPVCVARKPLSGSVAENVLEHRTGALNIDGCRVGDATTRRVNTAELGYGGGNLSTYYTTGSDRGRWPANVIHDGTLDGQSYAPFYYCAKASAKERGESNGHPTVKPISLMRYLVRLVTPKGGVVLDPYMGSGTTGVACQAEGFEFIGIDREAEYIGIAQYRLNANRIT